MKSPFLTIALFLSLSEAAFAGGTYVPPAPVYVAPTCKTFASEVPKFIASATKCSPELDSQGRIRSSNGYYSLSCEFPSGAIARSLWVKAVKFAMVPNQETATLKALIFEAYAPVSCINDAHDSESFEKKLGGAK